MIIRKSTLFQLNELLGLNFTGKEQDWAIEFADPERVKEFIGIAKLTQLSSAERYALLSLILASYDEYLSENIDDNNILWTDIVILLNNNPLLYNDLLNYWALWNEESTNKLFLISPLIRNYLNNN